MKPFLLLFFLACHFYAFCASIDSLRNALVVEYLFDNDVVALKDNFKLGDIQNTGNPLLPGVLYGKNASLEKGYIGNALCLRDSAHVDGGKFDEVLNFDKFTIMAWSKPLSLGSDNRRIEIVERTNVYWMNIHVKTLLCRYGIYDDWDRWFYMDGDIEIPLNEWTHTACTYDGSTLKAFVNGRFAGSVYVGNRLKQAARTLSVGSREPKDNESPQAYFDGLIDEFRVFNRDLPQEAIAEFMNRNNPAAQKPATPAALTATIVESSRVLLSWKPSSGNEREFEIFGSTDGVKWEPVKAIDKHNTEYWVTGLNGSQNYFYKVRAVANGGMSDFSNVVKVTTHQSDQIFPVANYRFEQNIADSFGSLHGRPNGNIYYSDGVKGAALDLTDEDSYVGVPYSVYDNLTINVWIKTDSFAVLTGNNYQPFYSHWYNGTGIIDGDLGGNAGDFGLSAFEDRVAFGFNDPYNSSDRVYKRDISIFSTTSVTDNKWHMITATIDTSAYKACLYVDGVLEDSASISVNQKRSAAGLLFIGRLRNTLPPYYRGYFKGMIDELSLYNLALDQSQIVSLFNKIKNGFVSQLESTAMVYPNPARGFCKVKTSKNDTLLSVQIFDLNGRLCSHQKITPSKDVSLNGLKSGVYILKIYTAQGVWVQKLRVL